MSLKVLLPLYDRVAADVSLDEFHRMVNIIFHDEEAQHYDQLHKDMVGSLQQQIDLLVGDLMATSWDRKKILKALDIGCGTGLSSQCIVNSELGAQLGHLTLLDTSAEMLKKAERKASLWQIDYSLQQGDLSSLDSSFDLVIISSVLHHIPDLDAFIKQLHERINLNGVLIHLQDPNKDMAGDQEFIDRKKEFAKSRSRNKSSFSLKNIIPKSLKNRINRSLGRKTYIDRINDKLIKKGITKRRMSADEIWSVTDIHVKSDLNKESDGISFDYLKSKLTDFQLINRRSYGFFGPLKSELYEPFSSVEEDLINSNSLNGRNLACIWIKTA